MRHAFLRLKQFFLFALFLQVSSAYAHSLPGSILDFSKKGTDLVKLTANFPLEELVIAAPELQELKHISQGKKISGASLDDLQDYIQKHIFLVDGNEKLLFKLNLAKLERAYNAHVGDYTLVVIELALPLPEQSSSLPLMLNYDIIMHEVRNHRAEVYWNDSANGRTKVVNFGYKVVNGNPKTYPLPFFEKAE